VPAIFQPQISKIVNKALSVWVIVISSDHKLQWPDSYKGVGHASTLPEPILYKIISPGRGKLVDNVITMSEIYPDTYQSIDAN